MHRGLDLETEMLARSSTCPLVWVGKLMWKSKPKPPRQDLKSFCESVFGLVHVKIEVPQEYYVWSTPGELGQERKSLR